MSAYPRWVLLEVAAEADLPLVPTTPPTKQPPMENEMPPLMDRSCSKVGCKNKISSQNKTGVCTPCQQGYPVGSDGWKPAAKRSTASSKPDADDAVLERVETSSVKPPPPAKAKKPKKEKAPEPTPAGPVEEFFTLAQALGLEPQEMLDGWCSDWVRTTRARALGQVEQPKLPANGLGNPEIAADYEKAREQAEAAEP